MTNATVIDATGAPAQPDMTVVITKDRITTLGKTGAVEIPQDAQVIDASGKFLIPGLWDMHTHIALTNLFPGGREICLPLLIANGITGVRDMGGDLEALTQWREEIARGAIIGPRIMASGPMLDGPKPAFPSSVGVGSAAEARRVLQELKQQGAHFIKVQSLVPREAYFAVVDEAKKQGLSFAGHIPDQITAAEASDAGQRSMEHLFGLLQGSSTEEEALKKSMSLVDLFKRESAQRVLSTYSAEKEKALLALLAKNGTWQCPTLIWVRGLWFIDENTFPDDPRLKYIPAKWQERWRERKEGLLEGRSADDIATGKRFFHKQFELVGALRRAGVPFLAGTDTPVPYVFPGFSLHGELVELVESGLTPMEALQSATRNAAQYFGLQETLGTVEEGKVADLVLLEANPLEEIGNTQKIAAVVVGGKLLSKDALQGLLDSAEATARKP